jgi:hypothetical protein
MQHDRGVAIIGKRRNGAMSKQYPECPLYNHSNCKDYVNPKLCAIVREDKVCVKKKSKSSSRKLKTQISKI